MTKSDAARILTRRLNINAGRASALLVAASDAGMLPKGSGKSNPNLSPLELAYLTLAIIADRGIGVAGQSAREFASLRTADGAVLVDLLEGIISGHVPVTGLKSLVVQLDPPCVSVTTASHHLRYGESRSEGAATQVAIRGDDLVAAILEMQGFTSREADEAVKSRSESP